MESNINDIQLRDDEIKHKIDSVKAKSNKQIDEIIQIIYKYLIIYCNFFNFGISFIEWMVNKMIKSIPIMLIQTMVICNAVWSLDAWQTSICVK